MTVDSLVLPSIPKRIIQTAKHADLPLRQRAAARSVKLANPDFEYLFFDNDAVEAFLDTHFHELRSLFDAFPFVIQRYDLFRYLAVYHYGGFYFDLDVFFADGLSGLLNSGCVFPFEELTMSVFLRNEFGMDWDLGNYGFGAAAGHPFLEAVINNCVRAQRDENWARPMMRGIPWHSRDEYYVLNTTGPGLVSRTFAENPRLADAVTVLFPDDVCAPQNWHNFGDFGVHLMESSWRSKRSFVRRRLGRYWEHRTLRRLLKESLMLGQTRNTRMQGRLEDA